MAGAKSVINPEAMARLRKDTKFAMSAKKAVNQFNNFSGPPGRYFGRLQRVDFRFHKTDGHPCFTFYHTCLAKCPDAGSDSNIIDQQHAGLPMKVFREVKVTEKMTKQDAWDAAMVDLQAYDIKTRNFGVRNGVEVQDDGVTFWSDLGDALDALQERRPAVIIDVSASKPLPGKAPRNFVNVRETVAEEIVARFASPLIDVSDEEMEVPDDYDADADGDDEGPSIEEQVKMLMDMERDKLIGVLESQDIKYMWQNMDLACIQKIGLAFIHDEPLPPPELFHGETPCYGWVRNEDESFSVETQQPNTMTVEQNGTSTTTPIEVEQTEAAHDEEEDDAPSSDDEEEDDAPAVDPKASELIRLQNTVANENREQLKARLRAMGALLPEAKFKKAENGHTDEFFRQWIVDVHTGKVAPAFIVAPTELPPF